MITGCVLSGISFVVFVLSIIDIAAIKNKKVYTAFEIGINISLLAVPVTISYIITRSIWAMVAGFGDVIGLLRANAIMIIISLVLTIPTALITKSK